MSRFFVDKGSIDVENNVVIITGEDVKHIGSVLRAAPGDRLELSDGSGTDYDAVIERISKDSILARIAGSRRNATEPPIDVILFQGIPKADKMDFIIQKCVELGVKRIVPVTTARTVVRFANGKDAEAKATRWRRIALEAAKQCDRGMIPEVSDPMGFSDAVKYAADFDLKLIPYEEESQGSLGRLLGDFKKASGNAGSGPGAKANANADVNANADASRTIAIFIGPEGGFTPEEVEKAVKGGFASVTLGPRILRTETAGLAAIAIIMYELGDMGADRK